MRNVLVSKVRLFLLTCRFLGACPILTLVYEIQTQNDAWQGLLNNDKQIRKVCPSIFQACMLVFQLSFQFTVKCVSFPQLVTTGFLLTVNLYEDVAVKSFGQ